MLHHSDLLEQLHIVHKHQMENLLVYMVVQPTPLQVHLQALFRGNLSPLQAIAGRIQFANEWSVNRCSMVVQWDYVKYFAFLDFKKYLTALSSVGKMYRVFTLMTNARTCLYNTQTSEFFSIDTSALEDYLRLPFLTYTQVV